MIVKSQLMLVLKKVWSKNLKRKNPLDFVVFQAQNLFYQLNQNFIFQRID